MRDIRAWTWVVGLVTFGCGGPTPPGGADGGPGLDVPAPRCALRFVPTEDLRTQIRAEHTLRVVLDPPEAGVAVRFALVGDALDATLADTERLTDADGAAEMTLVASSTPGTFRVRAGVRCGAEGYRSVVVSDRGFGQLAATTVYRGTRAPTRLQVGLQRALDCDPANGFEEERSTPLPLPGGTVQFPDVPAEVDYVVRATAFGSGDDIVASGCAGPIRVRDGRTSTADLLFVDAPLTFAARYNLSLAFDLSTLSMASAVRWQQSLTLDLQRRGGELTVLGDALAAAVTEASSPEEANAHREAFIRLWAEGLSARVASRLTQRGTGIAVTFRSLGNGAAAALGSARMVGQMRRSTERWSVTQLSALLDPGTPDVVGDDGVVLLNDSAAARLETAQGDGVAVHLEGVPLPYARLASSALVALTNRLGVASPAEYVALSVCPVVAGVVRDEAVPCDERCADTACRRAMVSLGATFEAALAATEAHRATVTLRFSGTGRAAPGGLALERVQGIASGSFVEELTAPVQAVAVVSPPNP